MNKREYASKVMKKAHEFYKKFAYSFSSALKMAHYWMKEQKNRVYVEYFSSAENSWVKWDQEFYSFKSAFDCVCATHQFSKIRIKDANDKLLHNYNF